MKRKFVRLCMVLTVLMAIFSFYNKSVYAIDAMQDGIKVISQSDQKSYKKGEKITTTVTVTNTNTYDMKNVNIHISVPDEFSADETGFNIPLLKRNETKEYKITVTEKSTDVVVQPNDDNKTNTTDKTSNSEKGSDVDTGDQLSDGMLVGLIGLTIFSGIAVVLLKKKRQIKKIFILALISAMTLSGLSVKTVHAEDSSMTEKHIYLTQPFSYENKIYKMDIDVQYIVSSDEAITKGEITREEWIENLLSLFDYNINDREYSFSDYADAKNPKIIETAIQYSIIDIEKNEAFYPAEYATREFVAYTSINALKYINTFKGSLECSDLTDLRYPNEDYLAVSFEILNLIENKFKPNQFISKGDAQNALNSIKKALKEEDININNNNFVDYQDNVKELNTDYDLDEENNTILFNDEKQIDIKKDDILVLHNKKNEEDDIAIKVEKIENDGTSRIIKYSEPELADVLKEMNLEGVSGNENATFIPAEDVTVNSSLLSRIKGEGELPMDGKLELTTKIGENTEIKTTLSLNKVKYRYNISYSLFSGIKIKDTYLHLYMNNEHSLSVYNEKDINKSKKFTKNIGKLKYNFGYGMFVYFDLNLVGETKGEVKIAISNDLQLGFKQTNKGLKWIGDMDPEITDLTLEGTSKFGIQPEVSLKWLKMNIAAFNIEAGIKVKGELYNLQKDPVEFCFDGNLFAYLESNLEFGPDIVNLKANYEFFNEDNSPFVLNAHFEETGKVDECTRDDNEEQEQESIISLKEGETLRITDNRSVINRQESKETLLNIVPGTVIDYAYYSPDVFDIVNGSAAADWTIYGFTHTVYTDPGTYYDVTLVDGQISLDKTKLDNDISVEKIDQKAVVKYTLKEGDTLHGLTVYGRIPPNGAVEITEIIHEQDRDNIHEYTYDSDDVQSSASDIYDYFFKIEMEFYHDILGTESTTKCVRGSVVLCIRSDTIHLAEVTVNRSN